MPKPIHQMRRKDWAKGQAKRLAEVIRNAKADLKAWPTHNLKNDASIYSFRTGNVSEEEIERVLKSHEQSLRELKSGKVKRDDAHLQMVVRALRSRMDVPDEVVQDYVDMGILKKREAGMDGNKVAKELVAIARELIAEPRGRELGAMKRMLLSSLKRLVLNMR